MASNFSLCTVNTVLQWRRILWTVSSHKPVSPSSALWPPMHATYLWGHLQGENERVICLLNGSSRTNSFHRWLAGTSTLLEKRKRVSWRGKVSGEPSAECWLCSQCRPADGRGSPRAAWEQPGTDTARLAVVSCWPSTSWPAGIFFADSVSLLFLPTFSLPPPNSPSSGEEAEAEQDDNAVLFLYGLRGPSFGLNLICLRGPDFWQAFPKLGHQGSKQPHVMPRVTEKPIGKIISPVFTAS